MNFQKYLADYLSLRRSMGFKLITDGNALNTFVMFLEKNNFDYITNEISLCWAKMSKSKRPYQWGRRLCFIRGFTRYLSIFDSRTEIPPVDLLPATKKRLTPYLFSEHTVEALLVAAKGRLRMHPFSSHTLYCLLGLMSVTGLRISEALNLAVNDVDFKTNILTVHNSKFGKSRLIPLDQSTINALSDYLKARHDVLAGSSIDYYFISKKMSQVSYDWVRYHFRQLITSIGINNVPGNPRPRIHDLRHYFAISTISNWYENGQDVNSKLPILSAYLGHVETRDTYWYISACPRLMNAATKRLEESWGK